MEFDGPPQFKKIGLKNIAVYKLFEKLEQINKQHTKTFMILAKDDHQSTWTMR